TNYINHAPFCVSWTKEKFVYVFDAPQLNRQYKYSIYDDTSSAVKTRDLSVYCRAIFNLQEKNSLGNDEKFTALMNKEGDVHFWMNSEEMYKGNTMMTAVEMLKLEKFYEGSITAATVSFGNGKIDVSYKTYVGEALKDLL